MFGAADALLLPTAAGQEFASVPSKLITYMLAGRPILLLADERSESAIELGKSDAGHTIGVRTNAAVLGDELFAQCLI
nr:glycosyltransferase family 4 protein [Pseudomonas sp. BIGb0427]